MGSQNVLKFHQDREQEYIPNLKYLSLADMVARHEEVPPVILPSLASLWKAALLFSAIHRLPRHDLDLNLNLFVDVL